MKLIYYLFHCPFLTIIILKIWLMGRMLIAQLWLLVLTEFFYTHGFLRNQFQVLDFALDGLKNNPTSFATLTEHKPTIPFPDVFSICWRSRTIFRRELHSTDSVEIPSNTDDIFFHLLLWDNGTDTTFLGKFGFELSSQSTNCSKRIFVQR